MGERRGTRGLELWCRKMTEGYPGVKIDNMTTSWRDGLAFCAIIHHFRPDLIDFSKLNKNDIYHNNELAFRVAEQYLGIPALLEPEDMVEFPVPDRLSILTYLSQFYQAFAVTQGSAATRIPAKRPQTATDHGIVSPASTSPPTKIAYQGTGGKIRREPCAKCDLPVFIAERLNVGKQLYHRTCFRCARCDSQLTLANYYETENNQFCCEMCPDEEKPRLGGDNVEKSILTRSMSDEEKTALNKLKYPNEDDEYSSQFESALENPSDNALKKTFTLTPENSSRFSQARSEFFESQIGDSNSDTDVPPDLPDSKPPIKDFSSNENSLVSSKSEFDSDFPATKLDSSVNSISDTVNLDIKLVEDEKVVTKDVDGEEISVVKSRLRLFERNSKSEDVNKEPVPLELPQDSHQTHSSLDNDSNKHSEQDIIVSIDHSVTTDDSADLTNNESSNNNNNNNNSKKNDESVIYIDDSIADCVIVKDDSIASQISNVSDEIEFIDDEENSLKAVEKVNNDIQAEIVSVSSISNNDSKVETEDNSKSVIEETSNSVLEETTNSVLEETSHSVLEETSHSVLEETSNSAVEETSISVQEETSKSALEENSVPSITVDKEVAPVLPVPRRHKKKAQKQLSYPEELNPFGDDEEPAENNRASLNPFGDEDEEEEETVNPIPSPRVRRKLTPSENLVNTPQSKTTTSRISCNPFEDEEDEPVENIAPQPMERKKVINAPRISLNPFWSGDEEEEEEENRKVPVPIPRYSGRAPEPRPRHESGTTATSSSHSSLASGNSNTWRKKKQAPKPPSSIKSDATESGHSSLTSSPSQSVAPSPRLLPKYRKSKKAPLPPTSTPISKTSAPKPTDLDSEKSAKDEMNRNRQSQNFNINSPTSSETSSSLCTPNKSTYGKWKRRKGQAPARPIPQRRTIKALPMTEIRRELEVIEIQQQGLEKQGVMIEQLIRDKSENNTNPDEPLSADVEDLILQLFELVNEKNELFRKQAELMYLRRQQRLEEEHADVEYQIRCLMLQPEANKTDSDKAREEELINRLVDIVERRNEIIECLEMDRVREAQEDDSINNQMNIYTSKLEEERTPIEEKPKKEKKKHRITKEKIKEKLFRKDKEKEHKVDVDKDIDESETPTAADKTKDKEKDKDKKKKKKLNIF